MSERRGPEPTSGGDTEAGEIDPGLEVERHPDMGEPDGHPEALPEDDDHGSPVTAPRVRSPAGSAEAPPGGGQPGITLGGAAEDPLPDGDPAP